MTIATTTNKVVYTGNGSTATFSIPFPFFVAAEIVVILRNALLVETTLTQGTIPAQQYALTGVDLINGIPGTGIQLNVAPAVGQFLTVKRIVPLTQAVSVSSTGPFPASAAQEALDRSTMAQQQLQEQLDRAVKLAPSSSGTPPTFPNPTANTIIAYDGTGQLVAKGLGFTGIGLADLADVQLSTLVGGQGLVWSGTKWTNITGGAGGLVGTPTDGVFGATGPIAGITTLDTIADGFDKVETIFAKLAPAKPTNLSGITLTTTGVYTAKAETTGTTTSNVTDAPTPVATATNFYDGDTGTLSAEIGGFPVGSRALTLAVDAGTYSQLTIVSDVDPYVGQVGKAGFWKQLTATVTPSVPIGLGANTFQFKHTTTGNSPILTIYGDNPVTPGVSGQSVTTSGTTSYVSGVPGIAAGQVVLASFTAINAVSKFYNSSQMGTFSGSQLGSYSTNPASPPATGNSVTMSQNMIVAGGAYSENAQVTMTAYNSKGITASLVVPGNAGNIRVDTVSNESARSTSGQGQYPVSGAGATNYGNTFVAATSLATAGNEELQMLGGTYQYPAGNYSLNIPAGPSYTAVPAGSYANYRWVTMNLGTISAASNTTLTFGGATNFGGSTIVSGLIVEVRVDGGTPTTGWIDGNANYPGTGNPTNNGDPAMVNASSSATVKVVTFGASPKTGNVWARVGIPSGSTKTFTGITRS